MPIEMRDQQRARIAYRLAAQVTQNPTDYKVVVNSLGANIIRMGLSAAIADLQRRGKRGGNTLLEHLGETPSSVLRGQSFDHASLPAHIRGLHAPEYMLLTREVLQFAAWLKRAVQAGEAE